MALFQKSGVWNLPVNPDPEPFWPRSVDRGKFRPGEAVVSPVPKKRKIRTKSRHCHAATSRLNHTETPKAKSDTEDQLTGLKDGRRASVRSGYEVLGHRPYGSGTSLVLLKVSKISKIHQGSNLKTQSG